MATPPPEAVMTIAELSGCPEIFRTMLYKPAQEGKLPGQKVGRRSSFHKDGLDRWLGDDGIDQ